MGKLDKSVIVSAAIFGCVAGYLLTAPEEVRWLGVPLLIGLMAAKIAWDRHRAN